MTTLKLNLGNPAAPFFNSLQVVKEGRLLTIGFRSELIELYNHLEEPKFSKRKLISCLDDYCKSPSYLSKDRHDIRYNICAIPTHRLVPIGLERC